MGIRLIFPNRFPFSSIDTIILRNIFQVFLLLLLLTILGEFFSSPGLALADSVTLTYVSDEPKKVSFLLHSIVLLKSDVKIRFLICSKKFPL